jgi:hypothetical protein
MSRSRMMVVHQEGLPKASQAFAEGEFEERMGGMSKATSQRLRRCVANGDVEAGWCSPGLRCPPRRSSERLGHCLATGEKKDDEEG